MSLRGGAGTRASRANRGSHLVTTESDVFDGLPIRQWRRVRVSVTGSAGSADNVNVVDKVTWRGARVGLTATAANSTNGSSTTPNVTASPGIINPTTLSNSIPTNSSINLPRFAHLLSGVSQQLLRAARAGRFLATRESPRSSIPSCVSNDVVHDVCEQASQKYPPPLSSSNTPMATSSNPSTDDSQASSLIYVTKWISLPPHMEECEVEYLAKRRNGLPALRRPEPGERDSALVRTRDSESERLDPAAKLNPSTLRPVKLKRTTSDGICTVWNAWTNDPEGSIPLDKYSEYITDEQADELLSRAKLPSDSVSDGGSQMRVYAGETFEARDSGKVIENVGVVDACGRLIVNTRAADASSTSWRSTGPVSTATPCKRRARGGPGRKRRKLVVTGESEPGASSEIAEDDADIEVDADIDVDMVDSGDTANVESNISLAADVAGSLPQQGENLTVHDVAVSNNGAPKVQTPEQDESKVATLVDEPTESNVEAICAAAPTDSTMDEANNESTVTENANPRSSTPSPDPSSTVAAPEAPSHNESPENNTSPVEPKPEVHPDASSPRAPATLADDSHAPSDPSCPPLSSTHPASPAQPTASPPASPNAPPAKSAATDTVSTPQVSDADAGPAPAFAPPDATEAPAATTIATDTATSPIPS